MLVLSRKRNESIQIGEDIVIKIHRIDGGRVCIGIGAPANVPVVRTELIPAAAIASDGSTARVARLRRGLRHER